VWSASAPWWEIRSLLGSVSSEFHELLGDFAELSVKEVEESIEGYLAVLAGDAAVRGRRSTRDVRAIALWVWYCYFGKEVENCNV
jgi:hypothetical protein